MTDKARSRIRIFYLFFTPSLLILALVLDCWWAWLPLLGFLTWIVREWLTDPSHSPKE